MIKQEVCDVVIKSTRLESDTHRYKSSHHLLCCCSDATAFHHSETADQYGTIVACDAATSPTIVKATTVVLEGSKIAILDDASAHTKAKISIVRSLLSVYSSSPEKAGCLKYNNWPQRGTPSLPKVVMHIMVHLDHDIMLAYGPHGVCSCQDRLLVLLPYRLRDSGEL